MGSAVQRRGPRGSRRTLFWVAVLAVVGLAVLFVSTRGAERRDPAASSPETLPTPTATAGREIATEKSGAPRRDRGGDGSAVLAPPDRDVDVREVYANFLELARFPPLSRPLGAEQYDLLHPYARYESPMMLTEPKGNVRPSPEDSFYGLFTADKYALVGADRATLRFKVWKGEKEGPGLAVQIDAVNIVGLGTGSEVDLGAISLTQVTDGGGVAYRGVLDLAALGASQVGEYRADLYFRGPDGEPVAGRLDFLFTPTSAVPAVFTGKYRDSVEHGSLIVSFQVEVSRAGRYDFNANLMKHDGGPVGWSRTLVDLTAGKHWVDATYFGLIFHDKGASGSFELAELRGERMMPGEMPDRELMPPPGDRYRTGTYKLEDFSSGEWDGPEKQEQIEMYERLIKEQDEGINRE